ncbi:oocyte zinc finger protein XlCOF6-like [Rhinatrema bivittatum]|uniref:oocyte zinc finger protein XlCOF6-like n=1 Tax=Rhinatrema bivittatum TaxID=194408 RepID=UPI00112901CA|nr:oocyte zinc finger protein XlCOF6-like [Rhinatrema bivittatum]
MFEQITAQASVTFHDVAVYFSEDEWRLLEECQKELYRNVMKEIHGALISLGYTIINSEIYFRIREENGSYFKADDLERSRDIKECTTSYPDVSPDLLLRIKEENDGCYTPQHISEGWDINNCSRAVEGYSDIPSSDPFSIKQEDEVHPTQYCDLERRELPDSCVASIPTTSPDSLFPIKEEEEISFGEQQVSERGGVVDNPSACPVSSPSMLLMIQQEKESYALDQQDCETKRSFSTLITTADGPFNCNERKMNPEKPVLHETMSEKGEISVFQCSEKEEISNQQQNTNISLKNPSGSNLPPYTGFSQEGQKALVPIVQHKAHEWRQHACTECEKSLSGENQFMQHQGIHTGNNTETYHWEFNENPDGNKMLSGRGRENTSCSDWRENCMNQCFSEKNCINSTVDTTDNSIVYEQSASNIVHKVEEKRNQATEKKSLYDVCGIYLKNPVTLKLHQRFHSEESSFICTDYGEIVSQKGELLEETKTHIGERPYSYTECGKGFCRKGDFMHHQKFNKGEGDFACTKYVKHLINKEILKKYQKIHTEERPFSNSECSKNFNQKMDLAKQNNHSVERPFSCNECGKSFCRKTHLTTHQKIHTGERPFSCTECGKSFRLKVILLTHQNTHTGERLFSCNQCGKKFTRKTHLTRHQKIHNGERPFSCSECGKSFQNKINLTRHQKIHTGERPFSCTVCDKSFRRKISLTEHQKIHTGEKPFSCIVCGKSFSQKTHLTRHQQIHTGERPFSCSECGKSFNQKVSLTKHHKIHTAENCVNTIASMYQENTGIISLTELQRVTL